MIVQLTLLIKVGDTLVLISWTPVGCLRKLVTFGTFLSMSCNCFSFLFLVLSLIVMTREERFASLAGARRLDVSPVSRASCAVEFLAVAAGNSSFRSKKTSNSCAFSKKDAIELVAMVPTRGFFPQSCTTSGGGTRLRSDTKTSWRRGVLAVTCE